MLLYRLVKVAGTPSTFGNYTKSIFLLHHPPISHSYCQKSLTFASVISKKGINGSPTMAKI